MCSLMLVADRLPVFAAEKKWGILWQKYLWFRFSVTKYRDLILLYYNCGAYNHIHNVLLHNNWSKISDMVCNRLELMLEFSNAHKMDLKFYRLIKWKSYPESLPHIWPKVALHCVRTCSDRHPHQPWLLIKN